MVKGFHPEPYRVEGSHNDAPKRVTIPAGIAAAGAKALSFRPEKPSCRSPSSAHARCLQGRPPTHDPGLSAPKRRQHQSPPTSTPCHPHGQREEPPPPPRRSPQPSAQSTFQGRRPGIHGLEPKLQPTPHRTVAEKDGVSHTGLRASSRTAA
jgi:hypothetical protein